MLLTLSLSCQTEANFTVVEISMDASKQTLEVYQSRGRKKKHNQDIIYLNKRHTAKVNGPLFCVPVECLWGYEIRASIRV